MSISKAVKTAAVSACLLGGVAVTANTASAAGSHFFMDIVYRTGPYGPSGTPVADGVADYINMINARDGGVNGIKVDFEECETGYNTDKTVECYERLKGNGEKGSVAVAPLSTGATYALIERTRKDNIPMVTTAYGRTDAAMGAYFPHVFMTPITYWGGASAAIKYMGADFGGMDKLKGKKIALVYHDSAYGKEPIKTLETLSKKYGFKFSKHPIAHPGLEQKATWLTIGRKLRPDYVLFFGWGVMNPTAIKEAAAVGFPREKMVGIWWSGSEGDTVAAGKAAKGYKSLSFHGTGGTYPIYKDLKKYIYDAGKSAGDPKIQGQVLYNRGIIIGMYISEGIRAAMKKFGNHPISGKEMMYGLENMDLSPARLAEMGVTDLMYPVQLSCADHEGGGQAYIQQWDGNKWNKISDWIEPENDIIRPMMLASAKAYAKEKGITPRDCK